MSGRTSIPLTLAVLFVACDSWVERQADHELGGSLNVQQSIAGLWVEDPIRWTPEPAPYESTMTAGIRVVEIRPDNSMRVTLCTAYRSAADSIVMGAEPGVIVHEGVIKPFAGAKSEAELRLVYRGIRIVGEEMPGPALRTPITVLSVDAGNEATRLALDTLTLIRVDALTADSRNAVRFRLPRDISGER